MSSTTTSTPNALLTSPLTTRLAHWSPIWAAMLALVAAVAIPGCGGGAAAAQPADPDAARVALTRTLDAWKSGAPHGAVEGLRVADDDWLAGRSLVSYRLLQPGEAAVVGARLHYPVELTLRGAGPKGKPVKRRVAYEVTTAAAPSVLRLDTP